MALKLYSDTDIQNIANAIRTKNGSSGTYKVSEMAQAIEDIPSGGGTDYFALSLANTLVNYVNDTNTNIPESAFLGRSNLESVEFTKLQTVGKTAFANCSKLASIKFPVAYMIGQNALQACPLVIGRFPNAYQLNYGAFMNCGQLTTIDVSGADKTPNAYIANNTFSGCTKLNVLVLRSASVWQLQNTGAFNNTPFASGKAGGTLYVPSSLVSSYQSATNWSTILGYSTNQILSIEGSIYETQYADGTAIE